MDTQVSAQAVGDFSHSVGELHCLRELVIVAAG